MQAQPATAFAFDKRRLRQSLVGMAISVRRSGARHTRRIEVPPDPLLVEFAVRWYPYGGGSDEDIFVLFGTTARESFCRLRAANEFIVDRFGPTIAAGITGVCIERLGSQT